MSDFDNGIPGPPERPDCKEFWQLSEIVLGLDASVESVVNDDQFTSVVERILGDRIPMEVVEYTASARTVLSLYEINPLVLVLAGVETIHALLMATWSDAFVAGMEYERKYGGVKS